MSSIRVEELIEEFDWFDGVYKRDEMEEALTLKEEITPRLISILESVAGDPELYAVEEHYANVYAAVLLAHFQEPAAHLPIIRAFCLPEELLDELWGDMVTGTLPALLFQTSNGRFDSIKGLIVDKEAPEYVRASAVEALTYAVARGAASREEVIAFLSGLFTGAEAKADSFFWSNVVCAISDLHPEEAMPVIRKAFEDDLVNPGYVSLENVEADLSRGREEMLGELRAMVDYRIPPDVHGYLSLFASFQESSSPLRTVNCALKAQRNKKKKSRAKSKQAKKARKKNRR